MDVEQKTESAKRTGKRFSRRKILLAVGVALIFVVTFGYILSRTYDSPSSTEFEVTFDFDSADPLLAESQNLPLNQTSQGVTAYFSSPSQTTIGSAFSIQSYDTTFITLSEFSGKYLYDNQPTKDILEIRFSQQIKSISFTFATIEYQAGPSDLILNAYLDSVDTAPVGTKSASGTIINSLYPQGDLAFDSVGKPFDIVRIELSSQASAETTNFFVDNIRIMLI